MISRKLMLASALVTLCVGAQANASLTAFQSYVGTYGLSTDGGGSLSPDYNVSAFVPVGSVVTAAYLYQSNFYAGASATAVSLNGNALTFSGFSANPNGLTSARADVTSIVAGIVDGGAGGTYDFAVTEGSAQTDGTALVVIYSNSSLPIGTIGILDGFSATGGDTTSINFASPLAPGAAGFFADLRLGIGYSCCNQQSTIKINGTTITDTAGNNDETGIVANGALITVGGDDDPFSTLLPTYANDHERYDLAPYITDGDTSILINTNNPSGDDNIFLAAFRVSGVAGVDVPPPVNGVPEPSTWAMLITGFGLVGFAARRRTRALTA